MTLDGTSGTEQVTVRAGLLTAAGLALCSLPYSGTVLDFRSVLIGGGTGLF